MEDPVEDLLIRHLPGLERFLARQAGGWLPAKESRSDLAQSVCRELLERARTERFEFQGDAEFKQWLYEAALLKVRNRDRYYRAEKRDWRQERRDRAPAGESGERTLEEAVPAATSSPSARVMRQEELGRLSESLALLPEADREIVRLAHLEGLSHREIAGRLGITESHSRTRLGRALARLARLCPGDSASA